MRPALLLLLTVVSLAAPRFAEAVPARSQGLLPPFARGTKSCASPIRRTLGGPGRRPGATVVPVSIRLEVLNAEGRFVGASSDATRAVVAGDEVTLRALVSNRSLYDIGEVRITHTFTPPESGPMLEGVGRVEGAAYDAGTRTFRIDHIERDTVAEFTFQFFFSEEVGKGLSESQIRLEYFEVLASERRHPPRGPDTPRERSRQTVGRIGIGTTDVACFTGSPAPSGIALPTRRRSDLPPLLTPMIGAGEELLTPPTTERPVPNAVSVRDTVMPKTGVELSLLYRSLEVLAGILLAFLLFCVALFATLKTGSR